MKVKPKSIIIGVLVVFLIYAVIVDPTTAADYVRAIFFFIADAVNSVFTFFDALLNR
ncbi:MAG: hypothetical protein IPJ14_16290 [Kineosporiaceae bacterium]|nr:hypothetical protein [Kineosporiaceae bacterium]MBK7624169.1 hypothetical protein [Kineosporiaceae bacterium]MBK8075357.1 hypothetical protein [Kineosporiaceae bacterium]